MKKITILCIFAFTFSNSLIAQKQWDWVFLPKSVPYTNLDSYISVSATLSDPEGNSYLNCISSNASITFGDQTFIGNSWQGRNFLIKLNNDGNMMWINETGTNMINVTSMALGKDGSLYSSGDFFSTFNYQGYTFDSEDAAFNAFVSKTDSNGKTLWIKQMSVGGDPEDNGVYINRFIRAHDTAVDDAGNVYVCGQIRGINSKFDNLIVPIKGDTDTFIAKYDPNGNILWVKTAAEYGYQGPHTLACDNLGNVYLAGNHEGSYTIAFDNTVLGGDNTSFTYLVKYNSAGDIVWLKSHGDSTTDRVFCSSLAIDSNNNIYTAGYFNNTSITFGSITLHSATIDYQSFVVKYNSEGDTKWAKNTGAINDYADDIQTGNDESVYVLGTFISPQITFGDTTIINEGRANGYITKIDGKGNYVWAEKIGGNQNYQAHMAVNILNNSIHIAGIYDNLRLGEQTYIPTTPREMYLAKLTVPGLSTPNFNKFKLQLYPNPAKDMLNVISDNFTGSAYSITDSMGRMVQNGIAKSTALDVSSLSSGLYLLSLNGSSTKFIKE